ncbi:hypothetical protein GPJ56_008387 [Histomonas meleagridis]|uniref:uncharacterized protein n=1 Tax=Histomonas meleagridis TaxID=135588 RepID=UPI00355A478B|nr:hypothetical protein GPJ56_008387 [Histomonas meleagridis]KAH0798923.1 hypothetical protein GO595_008314 [Histomonas meleagridis]
MHNKKRETSSYRPTSFSLKSVSPEHMSTRKGKMPANKKSQKTSKKSIIQSMLTEDQITDDIVEIISKLPPSAKDLLADDTPDKVTLDELYSLLNALNIEFTKPKRRRSSHRIKMLRILYDNVSDHWKAIYQYSQSRVQINEKQPKEQPSKPAPRSMQLHQPFLNSALSAIHQTDRMPTREEFIFMNDDEYETAIEYFRATHPPSVPIQNNSKPRETPLFEYTYGQMKCTTAALKKCCNTLKKARWYVDMINARESLQCVETEPVKNEMRTRRSH